ncbi:multicopper oxidase domain-containing protein [Actinomyces radicidentis]|uniref:multicopper oxidase domain-containing protein n=1 Tax=Actinomyces radicidentis TaxID=111015 RepID=UPI0026DEA1DF|nr:multicopper oxidase domain-containing protein [Actinomyces radicidentis]
MSDTNKPTEPQDQSQVQQAGTPTPRAARHGAVTSGTAPAVGRGRAAAYAQDTEAARKAARATDRRGALMGLVTAGAAVVVGSAYAAHENGGTSTTGSSASGSSGVTATGRTVRQTITVDGMRFVPATVSVEVGDRLVLTLDNTADQVHDLVLDVDGTTVTTGRVAAGASASVDAGVIPGPVEGWCSIAGHRAQGMVLHVTASGASAAATASSSTEHAHHGTSGAHANAVPDLTAPLPEGFTPWDAVLAPAPAATTHAETFTVTEVTNAYVGGGVTQARWTYNGTGPGPVLRGRVGDTFEITLVNEGQMSHSIDFHAGIVSPDEVMRSINPGESLVYRFTAQHSGIWLYHCSTAPMSEHIAAGMYGAVVIDPDGLADVDREYLLIQSETYLGPEGGAPDTAKIAAKTPDLMSFNGVAFQYALEPLPAKAGERVRFWVLDAGPSLPSSFHVVGLQFDTVFSEGAYLLGGPDDLGRAWHGGSQALALQPAQGGFVEAEVPAAGSYSIVTHAFADMEKGAKGILKASD